MNWAYLPKKSGSMIKRQHEVDSFIFANQILRYNLSLFPEAEALLQHLKTIIYLCVIDSHAARTVEYGGQTVILRLFEALSSNAESLLDHKNRSLFQQATDENQAFRLICDYIANMTDESAYRLHEQLFGARL